MLTDGPETSCRGYKESIPIPAGGVLELSLALSLRPVARCRLRHLAGLTREPGTDGDGHGAERCAQFVPVLTSHGDHGARVQRCRFRPIRRLRLRPRSEPAAVTPAEAHAAAPPCWSPGGIR